MVILNKHQDRHGIREKDIVVNEYRIRKLTPKECWRLMGFRDECFDRAKNSGMSDSALYKQAGNSIVVNVLEEIIKQLIEREN